MKTVNMETAFKRYNTLMFYLGLEHKTIGTQYSENTSFEWTLRDMVSECSHWLEHFYLEPMSTWYEWQFDEDPDTRKRYRCDVGRLKRFIKHYEPFIKDQVCVQGHCSKYD